MGGQWHPGLPAHFEKVKLVMANRIEKLLSSLSEKGIEAYVVTKGSDIKYLTGFTGE